jgi:hypothetical protein
MNKVVIVVPRLALTGGNLEAERLLNDLQSVGLSGVMLPIFPSNCTRALAILGAPFFALSLFISLLNHRPNILILTHYTTLPFAAVKVFTSVKVCAFVQDFEWLFLSPSPLVQKLMEFFHMSIYKHVDCFIFGNAYLSSSFPARALRHLRSTPHPAGILYPVGSPLDRSSLPASSQSLTASYDIGLILRNGWLKNEKMYYSVLATLIRPNISLSRSVSAVNLLRDSASHLKYSALGVNVRPKMTRQDLYAWMSGLKIFLCLSIHEGFGLPPLEAMALGAIPLVVENGGCMAYMGEFPELVLPKNSSAQAIADYILMILSWSDSFRTDLVTRLKMTALQYQTSARHARLLAAQEIATL